ncbi:conserved hypothetical protein [Theileria equi strain WA]|uniref:Uncharacterized protein n=1 Tax=Theileria equi strain WA TaxID=1537102 RepID=L1LF66_THEEQ|nr:conserved hypothetical protein [Theileria equi strain WA]EKX73885.1 conserved hypothetical protein [Theileria equi strain WA]|eukprot:XP_004833337.1 conserved hypothetical protein [Theileria equi strain WA]
MFGSSLKYYCKLINLPYEGRAFPQTLKWIYYCVFLTDIIQAVIFPNILDIVVLNTFNDNVFLSQISALHHVGATFGGMYWCLLSYFNLSSWIYNTPLYSSIILLVQLVVYGHLCTWKNRAFHVLWHTSYYSIYSSLNVSLTNLLILAIKSKDKGPYLVHYNVLTKVAHILGPLLNIAASLLPTIFNFGPRFLNFRNVEYMYILVLLFGLYRIFISFHFRNGAFAAGDLLKGQSEKTQLLDEKSTDETASYTSKRYSGLPWIIFIVNLLTTIGAGMSISLMTVYMMKVFKIPYVNVLFGLLCTPVVTALLIFVLNAGQKRVGKLLTIFSSKLIALW